MATAAPERRNSRALAGLRIGVSLVTGPLARSASVCGLASMLALLFASNDPGPGALPWQSLGASLDHLVLALCFAAFVAGRPSAALAVSLKK